MEDMERSIYTLPIVLTVLLQCAAFADEKNCPLPESIKQKGYDCQSVGDFGPTPQSPLDLHRIEWSYPARQFDETGDPWPDETKIYPPFKNYPTPKDNCPLLDQINKRGYDSNSVGDFDTEPCRHYDPADALHARDAAQKVRKIMKMFEEKK